MTAPAQHTPGPWTALDDGQVKTDAPLRRTRAGVQIGMTVAQARPYNREANARLIAAAPDLLAACLACSELLADLIPSCESKTHADAMRHCLAFVRAAIAKAEGGAS